MSNKYKPFDLQAALSGEKVITRDGREVTGLHLFKGVNPENESLYGVVDGDVFSWKNNGLLFDESEYPQDLFMAPKTVIMWTNINKSPVDGSFYTDKMDLWETETLAASKAGRNYHSTIPVAVTI